jgi:Tfp pilus assembly protein PilN
VAGAEAGLGAVLKSQMKSFRGKLAVALPTERVLLRVALLPSTDAVELRGMAELQTDKYSPFPVENMALGAETIESTETSSLVAMAAVRRDVVDDLGRAFQDAGAPIDVVDVEALGWWWALKHAGQVPAHGSQIFVRTDGAEVEMVAARDGAPLLFRSMPPLPAADEPAALDEWVAECAEETGYSLTSLETEWGSAAPPTLHVFHAPDRPAGWAEAFRAAMGAETLFTHSLADLSSASEGVARRQADPAKPMAMDLAPQEWREADTARTARHKLLRSATLFLAAWLLGLGVFWSLLHVQRNRLAGLRTEVEALERPALQIRRLRAKVLEFAQYADRTHSALECLRVVSETLPVGMDLTSFVYRKGSTLSLRGEADAPDKVYAFIQSLEQAALFSEVKSDGVSTRNTPQGPRSQFGATIRLPGAGEGEP